MTRAARSVARRLRAAAPVFSALGDETRLAIVARLSSDGPQSITSLTAEAHVTRQAVTKHLEALAAAGLVASARRGRERIWEIRPERLVEARLWLDEISAQWDDALERLRAYVEDDPT